MKREYAYGGGGCLGQRASGMHDNFRHRLEYHRKACYIRSRVWPILNSFQSETSREGVPDCSWRKSVLYRKGREGVGEGGGVILESVRGPVRSWPKSGTCRSTAGLTVQCTCRCHSLLGLDLEIEIDLDRAMLLLPCTFTGIPHFTSCTLNPVKCRVGGWHWWWRARVCVWGGGWGWGCPKVWEG